MTRARLRLFATLLMLPVACVPAELQDAASGPDRPDPIEVGRSPAYLLLQGMASRDTLIIEPVLRIDKVRGVASRSPDGAEEMFTAAGFDRWGTRLFSQGFGGARIASLPEEEHFSVVVPLAEDQVVRLTRVEVRAMDGRTSVRTASLSADTFSKALSAADVVIPTRLGNGRVQLRWDAHRFPLVMVRDPETREVLSFARGGEAALLTDLTVLEVTVSEGVRSGTRLVHVR